MDSISQFIKFLSDNALIILLLATHFFCFVSGFVISDKQKVFSFVLAWINQITIGLQSLNFISQIELTQLLHKIVLSSLSVMAGHQLPRQFNFCDYLRHKKIYQNEEAVRILGNIDKFINNAFVILAYYARSKTVVGSALSSARMLKGISKELEKINDNKEKS